MEQKSAIGSKPRVLYLNVRPWLDRAVHHEGSEANRVSWICGSRQAKECGKDFAEWYDKSDLEVINAEPEDAVYSHGIISKALGTSSDAKTGSCLPQTGKTSNQLYETVGLQLSLTHTYLESQRGTDEEILRKYSRTCRKSW